MATKKRWSQHVTDTSDALTLEEGVFKREPAAIARSLKRSAERSTRRKSSPFRSAMSMLVFYENRAGRTLPAARKRKIEAAKEELRKLYGKPERGSKRKRPSARRKPAPKKKTRSARRPAKRASTRRARA
jgi:hypothetical protein